MYLFVNYTEKVLQRSQNGETWRACLLHERRPAGLFLAIKLLDSGHNDFGLALPASLLPVLLLVQVAIRV
jgi:hypothetical protein